MNAALKRLLQVLLGLASLTGIGYLVFRILDLLLTRADNNIKAAIIASSVGLFSVLWTTSRQKKRELDESHRPEKMQVYKRFVELNFEMVKSTARAQDLDQVQLAERFIDFTRDVIFWGSPDVIRAYQRFRTLRPGLSTREMVLAVDAVLRAFRKDLGHSNFGLKPGDLFKLVLKDPAELDL